MKTALLTILLAVQLHAGSHQRAQQFFVTYYEAAEQIYFCHGIPIELSLSVWALESKYGASYSAVHRNNLGGIKSYAGGKKHNKHFATVDDFYTAFAAIFDKPCYSNDMQPKTVKEYLRAMEYSCCSYHHSSEYTRKINYIIKRYKIER